MYYIMVYLHYNGRQQYNRLQARATNVLSFYSETSILISSINLHLDHFIANSCVYVIDCIEKMDSQRVQKSEWLKPEFSAVFHLSKLVGFSSLFSVFQLYSW